MALVLADRVQENTTTTGTGSVTLNGAVTGYQTFAVIGNGNTTFYTIADQGGSNWEVGIGTYSTTGPTLARTTVLASSNSGSLVNFPAGTKTVFVTYPAEKSVNLDSSGNVSALGTIASGVWQGTTVATAYGGTGVTTSTGASSNVLRDANSNIVANNFLAGYSAVTAAAGTTVLTAASAYYQRLSGSTTQTFQLPDATTCVLGQAWVFDNDSSGTLTIVDNASGAVDTIPSGGYGYIFAESISTSAGSWGKYALLPANYDFNTTSANFGGAVISNTTYQGTAVASGYGGTGLTTFSAANNALYSTSSSDLAAGTLPVAAGGTGASTASITSFNNITGYTASGATGTTSTNLVFSTAPTITTLTAAGALTASATTQAINLGTSQTSGVLTVGGTAGTGIMTLGRSTGNQTTNIQAGATASGSSKTLNIGTGGLAGSTTNIIIGSANGTTTTIYGTSFAAADDAYFLSFMMG